MAKKSVSRKNNLRPFQVSSAQKLESSKKEHTKSSVDGYDYSSVDASSISSPDSFYLLSTNTHYSSFRTKAEDKLRDLSGKLKIMDNTLLKQIEEVEKREDAIVAAFARKNPGLTKKSFLEEMNKLSNSEESLMVQFNQEVLEDIIKYSLIKKIDEILTTDLSKKETKEYNELRENLNTITTLDIETTAKNYSKVFKEVEYGQASDISAILDGTYKKIGSTRKILHKLVKFKAGFFNEPLVAIEIEKNLKKILNEINIHSKGISSQATEEVIKTVEDTFKGGMKLDKEAMGSTVDVLSKTPIPLKPLKFDVENNIEIATDVKLSRDANQYKTNRKVQSSQKLSDLFTEIKYKNGETGNNEIRKSLGEGDHKIIFRALASAVLINNNRRAQGNAVYSDLLQDYFILLQKLALESSQNDYESQVAKNFISAGITKDTRLNLIAINGSIFYYSSLLKAMKESIDEGKLTLNMYGYLTRDLRRKESSDLYFNKIRVFREMTKKTGDSQSIAEELWARMKNDKEIKKVFEQVERNSKSMSISIKLKTINLK